MKDAPLRRRWPLLRLRTLMVIVAATSIPLGAWRQIEARRARFLQLAAHHRSLVICVIRSGLPRGHYGIVGWTPARKAVSMEQADIDMWHLGLSEKYLEAARRPWLPVPPDPEPPIPAARARGRRGLGE